MFGFDSLFSNNDNDNNNNNKYFNELDLKNMLHIKKNNNNKINFNKVAIEKEKINNIYNNNNSAKSSYNKNNYNNLLQSQLDNNNNNNLNINNNSKYLNLKNDLELMYNFNNKATIDNKNITNNLELSIVLEDINLIFTVKYSLNNNKVNDLKTIILNNLKNNYSDKSFIISKLCANDFYLMKNHSIINDKLTLKESNIQNNDIIYILLKEPERIMNLSDKLNSNITTTATTKNIISINKDSSNVNSDSKDKVNIYNKSSLLNNNNNYNNNNNNSKKSDLENIQEDSKENLETEVINNNNKLCSEDLLPTFDSNKYSISPSILELSRLTNEELKNVKNFKVYNKHGSVEFLEPVDLTNKNLNDIITIEEGLVSVYKGYKSNKDDNTINKELNKENGSKIKPLEGTELNKKSIITLNNIKGDYIDDSELFLFIENLKDLTNDVNGKFISYDDKNGGIWKFQMDKF